MATASRNPIEEAVNKNKVMKNHERILRLVNQNRSKIVPGTNRSWKIMKESWKMATAVKNHQRIPKSLRPVMKSRPKLQRGSPNWPTKLKAEPNEDVAFFTVEEVLRESWREP